MKGLYSILFIFSVLLLSCSRDLPSQDVPAGNGTPSSSYNINIPLALQLVNAQRQAGCDCGGQYMPPAPPVTWNDLLARAAYNHSKDMEQKNYFSHTGQDGSTPGDRIRREGYFWNRFSENIARGYSREEDVIRGWINSPGHCRNLMDPAMKDMGMGREGSYWTQVFATRY